MVSIILSTGPRTTGPLAASFVVARRLECTQLEVLETLYSTPLFRDRRLVRLGKTMVCLHS